MNLERAVSFGRGVLAFVVAHLFITGGRFRATLTPDPLIRPWFTNSTRAVLLTAALVALTAFVTAIRAVDRRSAMRRGVWVSIGAIVTMTGILIWIGAGTLAPIAVVVGGVILLAAGAAGGSIAALRKPV